MYEESTVARIPEFFMFNIRDNPDKAERAAMARPSKQSVQVIKDKSQCSSWIVEITCSLINCKRGEREEKNNEQHYQESIEFIGESTDLFFLQTKNMDL